VARILQFLNHIHGVLRKLILQYCWLGEDSTSLLANIVALYPDLEFLLLENCSEITSAGYSLIQHLKKLSELEVSYCEVDYMYVKQLATHVCMQNNNPRYTFSIFRHE
jgi:hypothetical protein